ncbi:hypothetical protein [Verrucomicrobium spinosum]|uniref:hypothetical protein n=1 Tax=Verrucomicrobium spinosum TaxID=2736 RepID=UPI0004923B89|nr:hypothetical protein [Verrucomicrobium spinosum]
MNASTEASPELFLDRFCGRESHPITEATWNLYHDDALGVNLCLRLRAAHGLMLHEDTASLHAEPWWEVDVLRPDLTMASLVPGARFSVPVCHDESRGGRNSNFYYSAHEDTDNNVVEVLEVNDERIRFRITGETIDVNFYDDSKPRTKLLVDAWFTRDPNTERSIA